MTAFDPTNLGSVLDAFYASLSGPAGERDWSLHKQVFDDNARLIRTGVDEDGASWSKTMNPAEYRENVALFFSKAPFYEIEIARRVAQFGNIAQAWSSYEMRRAPDAPEIERRGINSIQLFRGPDQHWRVVAAIWDNEREGLTLPE